MAVGHDTGAGSRPRPEAAESPRRPTGGGGGGGGAGDGWNGGGGTYRGGRLAKRIPFGPCWAVLCSAEDR